MNIQITKLKNFKVLILPEDFLEKNILDVGDWLNIDDAYKNNPIKFMGEEEYSVNSQGRRSVKVGVSHSNTQGTTQTSPLGARQTKPSKDKEQVSMLLSDANGVERDKTAEILNSKYPWKYKCGHTSKGIILDDNELSSLAYMCWKDTVGVDGDMSMCFSCYCTKKEDKILESKEQKICEKTNCRECNLNNCGCRE